MAEKPCKTCTHKEACITANPDMVKKTYQCEHYLSTDVAEKQEAEIERLKKAKYIFSTVDYCESDLAEALKENDKLKAENERLHGHLDQLKHRYDISKQNTTTAKAEAYKEFAERLKDIADRDGWTDSCEINDILKEMEDHGRKVRK